MKNTTKAYKITDNIEGWMPEFSKYLIFAGEGAHLSPGGQRKFGEIKWKKIKNKYKIIR